MTIGEGFTDTALNFLLNYVKAQVLKHRDEVYLYFATNIMGTFESLSSVKEHYSRKDVYSYWLK